MYLLFSIDLISPPMNKLFVFISKNKKVHYLKFSLYRGFSNLLYDLDSNTTLKSLEIGYYHYLRQGWAKYGPPRSFAWPAEEIFFSIIFHIPCKNVIFSSSKTHFCFKKLNLKMKVTTFINVDNSTTTTPTTQMSTQPATVRNVDNNSEVIVSSSSETSKFVSCVDISEKTEVATDVTKADEVRFNFFSFSLRHN